MAISEKEHESIRALVDESKETEEIAKKLEACLKRDHKSADKLRAVLASAGIETLATPLLPPPKAK